MEHANNNTNYNYNNFSALDSFGQKKSKAINDAGESVREYSRLGYCSLRTDCMGAVLFTLKVKLASAKNLGARVLIG